QNRKSCSKRRGLAVSGFAGAYEHEVSCNRLLPRNAQRAPRFLPFRLRIFVCGIRVIARSPFRGAVDVQRPQRRGGGGLKGHVACPAAGRRGVEHSLSCQDKPEDGEKNNRGVAFAMCCETHAAPFKTVGSLAMGHRVTRTR